MGLIGTVVDAKTADALNAYTSERREIEEGRRFEARMERDDPEVAGEVRRVEFVAEDGTIVPALVPTDAAMRTYFREEIHGGRMSVVTEYPTCDLCGSEQAHYDVRLNAGMWANVCDSCLRSGNAPKEWSGQFGLGRGQQLTIPEQLTAFGCADLAN